MNSNVSEVEKSALVMRLERNQKDLLQLKSKLNSYTCEPRTYLLHERIEKLRQGLENLRTKNSEVMVALIGSKETVEGFVERTTKLLTEFNQLQQGIEEYVVGARNG